jgi:4-diphosphocytidyl-2-C-methyl-D-erythritol kinase
MNEESDMNELKVLAPAKVNLFLGIGARREDGYHQAQSILHALALHDVLSMRWVPKGQFAKGFMNDDGTYDLETWDEGGFSVGIETQWREGMEPIEIPLRENLAARAAMELARACGFPGEGYLRMRMEKHIPAQAGLGGGSSDAAAALVGCAHLWGIDRDDARVEQVARSLGADVAFFLRGGCGVYANRGDVFERSLPARKDSVLLVIPEGGVSTGQAYKLFDDNPQVIPDDLAAKAAQASSAAEVPLFNNLAPASEQLLAPLAKVREWAAAQEGIRDVLLSGSGSATFCVCDNPEVALRLAVEARMEGWSTRVTNFSSLRASILPTKDRTNLGASRV